MHSSSALVGAVCNDPNLVKGRILLIHAEMTTGLRRVLRVCVHTSFRRLRTGSSIRTNAQIPLSNSARPKQPFHSGGANTRPSLSPWIPDLYYTQLAVSERLGHEQYTLMQHTILHTLPFVPAGPCDGNGAPRGALREFCQKSSVRTVIGATTRREGTFDKRVAFFERARFGRLDEGLFFPPGESVHPPSASSASSPEESFASHSHNFCLSFCHHLDHSNSYEHCHCLL